jgi:predicted transcriptional regulator
MAVTLKLPPALKTRVKSVVKGTEKSAHAFMVEAIERETTLAEKRKAFVAAAARAEEHAIRTGKAYTLEDIKAYYAAKAEGRKAKRPRLKRWRT